MASRAGGASRFTRRAWRDHPARRPRRRPLPRQRRRPDARPRSTGSTSGSLPRLADDRRARLPPRAAAPGAAAHGHQARAVAATRCGRPTPAGPQRRRRPRTALGWVDVEGGLVEIGHEGDGFRFDNELPRHQQCLEPYRLADRLVTNGEWLEFMADGGYRAPRAVALRRLGQGQRRGLGRAALLDASSTARWFEHTPQRHLAGRPGPAGEPRQLLRGRRLRHVGRQAAAHRGRVGARRRRGPAPARRRPSATSPTPTTFHPRAAAPATGAAAPALRRLLGVDRLGLPPLPRLPPAGRRHRRVQRQVHVQPDGAARRLRVHPRRVTRAPPTATSSRTASRWALSGVRLAEGQVALVSRTRVSVRARAGVGQRGPRRRTSAAGLGLAAADPPAQVALRRRGLAALRRDHPPAGVLPDRGRAGDPARPRRRDRRPRATPPPWSSSGAAPATRPGCCSRRSPTPAPRALRAGRRLRGHAARRRRADRGATPTA